MNLAPGTRLGAYEIVAALGAGGMGEVYRARDTRLGREAAIKILPEAFARDEERLARFEREAKAVAALTHPNILAIYDFGTDRGCTYAAMELLEGVSLREVLAAGALPARKTVEYAGQIASGLAAAHDKGIVHRDLKPENLFLTRDGQIKILDFGLAVQALPGGGDSTVLPDVAATALHTSAGLILGTVGYMAPEQARAQKVDHRADIFSLGCVIYEMLTGVRAFQRDSAPETLTAILREEPPAMAALSPPVAPALERLVLHCLEKRPEDRFQSARDLAFALQALSGQTTASGITVASVPAAARGRARAMSSLWMVAAGIGLVAIGGLSGRLLLPAPPKPSEPRATRLTFDRGTVRSARFAPDGQTVVYGASWGGRPYRIFQTRPGNPESSPLQLPEADVLSISPSGDMAISPGRTFTHWVASGRLARAAIVGGASRDMLDMVRAADWGPDGRSMAIVRRVNGKDVLEYPMGTVLYESNGYISDPRVAPAGGGVGFLDHPVFGDNRGFVALVTGPGTMKRLGPEWSGTGGLAWSPDGSEIWFTAGNTTDTYLMGVSRDGRLREIWRPPVGIVLLDIAASGHVLLTRSSILRTDITHLGDGEAVGRDVSWFSFSRLAGLSRDGRLLLFNRFDEGAGADYQIGVRRIDESTAFPVGPGAAIALSPDGRLVLGLAPSDPSKLLVFPVGAGETRTVSAPGFTYANAAWFPDGTRLLVVADSAGQPGAYIQDLAGSAPRRVPVAAALRANSTILVSPDSRSFVARPRDGGPVIVQMDDGRVRLLAGLGPDDDAVAVSGDGKALFVQRRDPESQMRSLVLRYDLASGRLDLVRRVEPADLAGVLDRPTCFVTPDGRTIAYAVQRYLTDLYLVEGLR